MTDWLLALVPQYGVWLLAACTFLSCLGLPIPASILMLTAGGFVAAGDLSLTGNVAAALGGAVAGDQAGYFGGRWGGAGLIKRLGSNYFKLARARIVSIIVTKPPSVRTRPSGVNAVASSSSIMRTTSLTDNDEVMGKESGGTVSTRQPGTNVDSMNSSTIKL